MTKTKRKQLAALAALKFTPSESLGNTVVHQDEHCPDENSASLEVRQQRIVFWIPSDPSPRLVNPRSFGIGGSPSRKRQRSTNAGEECTSDGEEGHVYQKYSKIILKLDKCNLEKGVGTSLALNTTHVSAERAFQRRKPGARLLTKEKVLSVLKVNTNCPDSPSVQAIKRTTAEDKDELPLVSLSDDNWEKGIGFARELPPPQYSRILKPPTRKTVSYNDLVSAKPAHKLRLEQDEAITDRKILFNFTRKLATVSEKDVDPRSERTWAQDIVSHTYKRQKTRLLVDTLSQHEQTLVRAKSQVTTLQVSCNERNLRSVEKNVISESSSAVVVRVAYTESALKDLTTLKKKLSTVSGNTVVLGRAAEQSPRNDVPAISNYSDSPSNRKGNILADRPASTSKMVNVSSSSPAKATLHQGSSTFLEKPNGQTLLRTSLLRTRKRVATQAKGNNSVSTVPSTRGMKMSSLAELDDCKGLMASELGSIYSVTEVRNSESAVGESTEVPLLDESNRDHLMRHYHGSDVVTSSNNAIALNSRSRRISFLCRNAGGYLEEEDPFRGEYLHRSLKPRENFHSRMSTPSTTGSRIRGQGNVHRQLGNRDAPHAFQSYINGSKTNGRSVELIRQQGEVLRDSKSRHRCFDSRSLSLKSVGYKRINHAADMAALVQSKLNEVGGLTEWLIGGGLGCLWICFKREN